MRYLVTTLPADPAARALRLAHERALGGTFYHRTDDTLALVRVSWPYPSSALVSIDAIPGDWTEITA